MLSKLGITKQDILQNMKQSEIALAVAMLFILSLLFVPLPAFMLDMMFTVNITSSVVILMTVMFINRAMEFSSFPMILLITTMLRLALNVASTRLILSEGHQTGAAAGKIIQAFGELVMSGQFLIGLIIFLILVIINFIVITKGAGRIAEVAARFTLDSLPGKQMAIDADLNSGLITEDDARTRRRDLEQETGFYGAMDGASKFVRGDAVAGLIITSLNILVGISIGMTTHDMTFADASDRYMLLTVGDGLVAQIPALIISTAAGILVAKSGTNTAAGKAVFDEISANPKALIVGSILLLSLGLLPNMPILPFFFMGGALGAGAYYILKNREQVKVDAKTAEQEEALEQQSAPQEEPLSSILHIDTLRLELGYSLLNLIDESKGGKITDKIKKMRQQMAREMGFVVPSVRIQDNVQLEYGGYAIYIKDIKVGDGILKPEKLLAIDATGSSPPIEGEDTLDPTFGLPAKWIDENKREDANYSGYTVADCATIIMTHLTEIIKDNLSDLLTRKETESLLDQIRENHGKLIDDLIPGLLPLGSVQRVFKNLLKERVSIRDLPTILEALGDIAPNDKNIIHLTEFVRQRLNRQICTQCMNHEGIMHIVALSAGWEKEFMNSVHSDGDHQQLSMEPSKVQVFISNLRDAFETHNLAGLQPVLLTSSTVRPFVRSLIERTMPGINVLSQAEIHPKVRIKTVGTL